MFTSQIKITENAMYADLSNSKDCCSMTAYGFYLLPNSSVISWRSVKQNTVILSSCEAEFKALAVVILNIITEKYNKF